MEKINTLLEKYNNFKDAQIRSIENISDSSKLLTLVIQDDDGEDVSKVKVTFNNVRDSKILVNDVLPFLDMMSGISIIKENNLYGFAVGRGSAMLHVNSAPLYIISSDIEIKEIKEQI